MKVPYTKAHGAHNDFLLTWRGDVPDRRGCDHADIARAICERHTGVGADGWMLVDPPRDAEAEGAIELYNSDGSRAEISGQRHPMRRCVPHPPRAGGGRGTGAHRGRDQDAASAPPPRPRIRVRDEHGPRRDPGGALCAATGGGEPRRHAAVGRESAVRDAGGRFRFRLARAGRGDRAPPALSRIART